MCSLFPWGDAAEIAPPFPPELSALRREWQCVERNRYTAKSQEDVMERGTSLYGFDGSTYVRAVKMVLAD